MSKRACVVGLGRMGRFHRRALIDLGYDVTTVDPSPAAGADFVALRPQNFAAVCIAVPIAELADQAMRWAPYAGALLVEKPMAPDPATALELAAVLAGRRVAVGYCERFNPGVLGLRAAMAGRGPWVATFTRWNLRPTADPVLDLMSHDVDLAAWLGVAGAVYDVLAPAPNLTRRIDAWADDEYESADLLDHGTSPIHAMWAHLLDGQPGPATVDEAAAVVAELARRSEEVA